MEIDIERKRPRDEENNQNNQNNQIDWNEEKDKMLFLTSQASFKLFFISFFQTIYFSNTTTKQSKKSHFRLQHQLLQSFLCYLIFVFQNAQIAFSVIQQSLTYKWKLMILYVVVFFV